MCSIYVSFLTDDLVCFWFVFCGFRFAVFLVGGWVVVFTLLRAITVGVWGFF